MTHSINGLYHGLRDKCERINLEVTDIVHYLWTRIRTAVETREIGGQRTSLHLILMLVDQQVILSESGRRKIDVDIAK